MYLMHRLISPYLEKIESVALNLFKNRKIKEKNISLRTKLLVI